MLSCCQASFAKTTDTLMNGSAVELSKNGKTIFCRTDNFVPLVVPGLTTNTGSSSSSTTPSQESLDLDAPQASGNGAASRSSEDSVSESRNEQAFGNGGEKSA